MGFALVVYELAWWRDVIEEAEFQGHHTPVVQIGHRYGMTLFIASEVMFFVAWFWAILMKFIPRSCWSNMASTNIKTFDPWDIPLINTLILLLSGTTVMAHHAMLENDRKSLINGLVLTVFLGLYLLVFKLTNIIMQLLPLMEIFMDHLHGYGFHGFHVIVGTIFLAVCLFRCMKGHSNSEHHFGFEAAAWYCISWMLFGYSYLQQSIFGK